MLKLLTSRLFWTLSPERADEAVRSAAIAGWMEKYQQGASPHAPALDRSFHASIDAGMKRLSNDGTRDAPVDSVDRLRIHLFAAYYLPTPVYEIFFSRIVKSQKALELSAAIFALHDAQAVRTFPNLRPAADRPRPKPVLQSVDEIKLREEWRKSKPLVSCRSPREEIVQILAGFSADDLHEMAHGDDVMDAPLIEAIASHPLCDWGSACEILHSFSASAYQMAWRDGKLEDSYREDDRALFRAFAVISDRARNGNFRSRRFKHNWDVGKPLNKDGSSNLYHPKHWVKWRIAENALFPTNGEKHRPDVTFDGGKVLPSFERWKRNRELGLDVSRS